MAEFSFAFAARPSSAQIGTYAPPGQVVDALSVGRRSTHHLWESSVMVYWTIQRFWRSSTRIISFCDTKTFFRLVSTLLLFKFSRCKRSFWDLFITLAIRIITPLLEPWIALKTADAKTIVPTQV